MKNVIKTVKAGVLASVLGLASCTSGFEEMNIDPNNPAGVDGEYLLTTAQRRIVDEVWDAWNNARTGMYYAQYWSATSYTEESRYQIREGVNNGFWNAMYASVLTELKAIQTLNEGQDSPKVLQQNAISNVMQAYVYHVLTDFYTDVPFSMSNMGAEAFQPEYDKQSDIYSALLTNLKADYETLKAGGSAFGGGDIIYGGDAMMWAKFANSLRLRIAMRMADVNSSAASAVISEVYASGDFISSPAENALFRYLGASPNANPLYETHKTREDFALSETLADYMIAIDDPRRFVFGDLPGKAGATEVVGHPYGLDNANATAIPNEDVSLPSGFAALQAGTTFPSMAVLAPDAPAVFMESAEVHFILAEAVERGFITADAEALYNEGVKQSMNFWGISDDAAIADYLTRVPYNGGAWKDVIGTQKWMAMYMQGIQGWFERIRLDFGKPDGSDLFVAPEDGSSDPNVTMVPTRMSYPTDEQRLNSGSYDAAVSSIGADTKGTKNWWDAN